MTSGFSDNINENAAKEPGVYFRTENLSNMKKILSISVFLILVVIEIYAQCPPDAPTGNSPQSFCTGNNPTIANLTATGTTIQWYAAATGGSPLATSIALIDGTTYFASQTISECESVIRLAVAVILNDPAAPTGNSVQSFCAINNPTIDNLTAEGTSIQWYPAATGGTALSSSTPLVSGTTYYAGQTIGGCISDTRLAVAVTVGDPSAPTGISSQSFCAINNPTIANLTAAGTAIQWYIISVGGNCIIDINCVGQAEQHTTPARQRRLHERYPSRCDGNLGRSFCADR